MERTIKMYEDYFFEEPGWEDRKSNASEPSFDFVAFEKGDAKKLAALVKALGHNRLDLRDEMWSKNYLEKGPIYVINSEYYYNPATKTIVDSKGNRLSLSDLCTKIGCKAEDLLALR